MDIQFVCLHAILVQVIQSSGDAFHNPVDGRKVWPRASVNVARQRAVYAFYETRMEMVDLE